MRIFLVEDEHDLAHWLSKSLQQNSDWIVEWSSDGALAFKRLGVEDFDVIILDLGLPGIDGVSLIKKIRELEIYTPILILTARDTLTQRVQTLELGADDFLAKPFSIEELKARLTALVRRSRGLEKQGLSLGNLKLDLSSHQFTLDGEPLALTPRELAVLRALMLKSGEPISKQFILDRLIDADSDLSLEAIEVIIHRLRKKLLTTSVEITTLRGIGYCLQKTECD
ncbi:MAG: response regulator [Alcaligenaceae bacterium]|jgi:two-component system response regulator TctD|nr:response regulator [Alcaligenaceae bacterium]HZJ97950.1 response regulator [Oligella sp.]